MVITPTYNMDFVRHFLLQDDIFERASDGTPKEDSYPADGLYLLVVEKDDIVGIIRVEQENNITVKIHPYMLKQWRHLSRKMLIEFYKLCQTSEVLKVIASIPTLYRKVFNFALKVGFTLEGINRQSYLKEGILYDQWVLGITKEEMRWVQQQQG